MRKITPLQEKFAALPKGISFEKEIEPVLKKHDISISTFYRDLKNDPKNIEHFRLQVYAALFDCDVSDLIDSYVKIKPIIRKNLSKKSGLKTQ
jgi:hypothetical protein